MSPFEITQPGGSVEHFNEEAGHVWLQRLTNVYSSAVWLNPSSEPQWMHHQSTRIIREIMDNRMFPLTLSGLDAAMRSLTRKK